MTPGELRVLWEGAGRDWALAAAAAGAALLFWRLLKPAPKWNRVLRAGVLAVLALLAAKPALLVTSVVEERPKSAVLLDVSRGMARTEDGVTDHERAVKELRALVGGLQRKADVTLYAVGTRAVRKDLDALAEASPAGDLDIAQALDDVWRDQGGTLEAVWLVSNGAGDKSRDLSAAVSKLGAPVYTASAARPRVDRGLRVDRVKAPEFAFLHLPFPLTYSWTARGIRGERVRVRVLQQGRELASAVFEVGRDFDVGTSSIGVVSPALGTQTLDVEFSPENGTSFKRIRREVVVETVREKLRILYLAGHPSFEYAHLRHYLKSNPNFELVSFVILRNPENVVPVPESELSLIPFPAQEIFVSTLDQFDLFILEDFSYSRFSLPPSYLDFVRRFVERGGGLMLIGGPNGFAAGGWRGTPLEALLPTQMAAPGDWKEGPVAVQAANPGHPLLNLEGSPEASARLWGRLPRLDGMNRFSGMKPWATTFLTAADERPPSAGAEALLAGGQVGKGRTLVLASPSTWRWKLAGASAGIGAFYEAFWQRCIQYLTGSLELGKVRLAPLAEQPVEGEPFTVWANVVDETFSPLSDPALRLEVRVRTKEGKEVRLEAREVRPGVYQTDVQGLPAGVHRIDASAAYRGRPWGTDSRSLSIRQPSAQDAVNRVLLEEIARRSGGAYSDLQSLPAEDWLAALPDAEKKRGVTRHVTVWAGAGWLWLLMGLLIADWYLRRSRGLR